MHFHDAVPELLQKVPDFGAEIIRLGVPPQIYRSRTNIVYPWGKDFCVEYHSHTDPIGYHCELTAVSLSLMKIL
jgi:hypothetical protein